MLNEGYDGRHTCLVLVFKGFCSTMFLVMFAIGFLADTPFSPREITFSLFAKYIYNE